MNMVKLHEAKRRFDRKIDLTIADLVSRHPRYSVSWRDTDDGILFLMLDMTNVFHPGYSHLVHLRDIHYHDIAAIDAALHRLLWRHHESPDRFC